MGPDNEQDLVVKDAAGKDIKVGTRVAFIVHGREAVEIPAGTDYWKARGLKRRAKRTRTIATGVVTGIWQQVTDSQGSVRRAPTKRRVEFTINNGYYKIRTLPAVVDA